MIDEWQAEGVGTNSVLRVPARLPGILRYSDQRRLVRSSGLGQGFAGCHDRCRNNAEGTPNTVCRRSRRQVCRQFRLRPPTQGDGRQSRPVLPAGRGDRDGSYGRASSGSSFLEILSGLTGGRCRIAQKFRLTLRRCRILPDWWIGPGNLADYLAQPNIICVGCSRVAGAKDMAESRLEGH